MDDPGFAEFVAATRWGDDGASSWARPAADLAGLLADGSAGGAPGVATGIGALDVAGGAARGSLTVAHAQLGDATPAVPVAVHAARCGHPVLLVLLGDTVGVAARRLVSAALRDGGHDDGAGGGSPLDAASACRRLGELALQVCAGETFTAHDLRLVWEEADDAAELVVVDRYPLLAGGAAADLKRLAVELGVAVLATAGQPPVGAQLDPGLWSAADAVLVDDGGGMRLVVG